ncbi:MAG: site-2 protease family protein [Oscillospiraceae bacterium]|nr:site-2 protease family protein [Oscillospiraceae bacterium]
MFIPNLSFQTILARAVVLLTALPVHEAAHAWVAYKMGDNTARYRNRLTLNPFDHIDPIGAVMILLFGIGFARPVPVNYSAFYDRKKGIVATNLAGPLSNVFLAWIALILAKVMMVVYAFTHMRLANGAADVFLIMVSTNLSLAVFNLLPIPPLDGWHALQPFIPYQWAWKIQMYERQLVWGVLLLVWLGAFDGIIGMLVGILYRLVSAGTFFVDFIFGALI